MEMTVRFVNVNEEPTEAGERITVRVMCADFHVGFAVVQAVLDIDGALTWQIVGGQS